ncbi:MAG TPA: aldose 1-epimerase family protein [Sphingomonas sp.]|jgi:galactose mutarotase-like enzyme
MVRIGNGLLSAAINPFGAELSHLEDAAGRELMTDADPAFWRGRAPLLFPVVGRVHGDAIRVDGREHPMAKHGFARRSIFEVVEAEETRAVFALTDSEETRVAYPFAFRLEVEFRLDGLTLRTDVRIENPGADPLPAQFGFHPAFAWPLPFDRARADHRILFGEDEPGLLRGVTPDGFLTDADRASPLDGRELRLADHLFEHDALVWDPVRSRRVRYGAADGPQLEIAFDAPRLGVWTLPGARYVCVEPWHGHADPEDFAGEYRDKPGVFTVPSHGEWRTAMSVTLAA